MTNRQLAAAETRKKLVESAKAIICDKGLSNTSVEEITEASGVSKGTFYTYFKRKEDIVFELSGGMFDEILAQSKALEGPVLQKLEAYMVRFARYIEKGSVKLAQEWIKNVVDPGITDIGVNKLAKDLSAVDELLRLGVASGELKANAPIRQLSGTITDLLYGQMACWAISGGSYSYEERTRAFCETHLENLLKPYVERV